MPYHRQLIPAARLCGRRQELRQEPGDGQPRDWWL